MSKKVVYVALAAAALILISSLLVITQNSAVTATANIQELVPKVDNKYDAVGVTYEKTQTVQTKSVADTPKEHSNTLEQISSNTDTMALKKRDKRKLQERQLALQKQMWSIRQDKSLSKEEKMEALNKLQQEIRQRPRENLTLQQRRELKSIVMEIRQDASRTDKEKRIAIKEARKEYLSRNSIEPNKM